MHVEGLGPIMTGRVFLVMVHPNHKFAFCPHPVIMYDLKKVQRVMQVVQTFHAVDQVDGLLGFPIRKLAVMITSTRVDSIRFFNHSYGSVNS